MIRRQGMPSQRHHEPGDLFVKLNVTFPESISASAVPLLERALPPRNPLETFEKKVILEEATLDDVDPTSRSDGRRDEPMDEDQEEPRVQCANQ